MATSRYHQEPGRPHPLGSTPDDHGVNFAVFSQHATAIELLLFDEHDDPDPVQVIRLDPRVNKTFHFWHVYVRDLKAGTHYAYRVDGPQDGSAGHRFNRNKVLIDPYSKGNTHHFWNRVNACGPGDNLHSSMRSAIIDIRDYDWEGDKPLNRPMSETIVYEMHVGGFTKHSSSGITYPGTFWGVIEKIPYLKELGVTAVELLPVCEFDESEVLRTSPITGKPLVNYWGYSPLGYFSPQDSYCVEPEQGCHVTEFRDMVKALHKAGIEVILDVVFNHTNEGNHEGPVINFKGFDNSIYYYLAPDKRFYYDYSGCGNTLNCNHPVVEKMIVECLEYWVQEMHVDGFRFDEGSVLSRDEDGRPMQYPPVLWHIELSEILADTKVIAEAWDAAGLYQIGHFPGFRWSEWNGRFRDDIRRFVKGDPGMIDDVASRITGSADLYQTTGHLPVSSVNFVACHDGFTLNDLVSYNSKHNEANGEDNRDGVDDNMSWNCGAEGESDDPAIEELRQRQIKNFTAILLLSQGVPMILSGDEVRHTQQGNNNAYCQDSEISWFDWSLAKKNHEMFRFFKEMIAFRKRHPILHRKRFFSGERNERDLKDIDWHGCKLSCPGWDDPNSRILAFTMGGFEHDADMHVIFNMEWEDLDFEIPPVVHRTWYRAVDTALPSPEDIVEHGREVKIGSDVYRVKGHSVVILISKNTTPEPGGERPTRKAKIRS